MIICFGIAHVMHSHHIKSVPLQWMTGVEDHGHYSEYNGHVLGHGLVMY